MSTQGRRISRKYRSPLRDSLILQAFFLFLFWLALDGGNLFRYSLFILALNWALIFLIVPRRPAEPSPLDLEVVRFCYLALWILLLLLSPLLALMTD